MSHPHLDRLPLTLGTLLLTMSATPAVAQQTATDDSPLEEVIVTAEKRSERLQDVPASISVLGGETLHKQRLTEADDLVTKVPNLQLSSTVGDNTPIFSLRGVSMSDYSLNQNGPVATYYDEVYKGNFAFLGVNLFDLERVEVLRGPQGTLYGKNTTGGAVNLISRAPSFYTDGYMNVGIGNYNRHEANGALNVPLSDTVAARVAFTYARADGWYENGLPDKPDLDGVREYGVRTSLLWEPMDRMSFVLRVSTSLQNPYNYGVYAQPGPNGVGNGLYEQFGQNLSYFRVGLSPREIESEFTPRRHARTEAIALTTNIEVGSGLTVTSVTSWDRGSLFVGEDTDGSPNKSLEIAYTDRARQVAQDLRLTSAWDAPFNFILGAYFDRETVFNSNDLGFYQDLDANGDGTVDTQDCLTAFPFACLTKNSFDQEKKSYALYSDLRYRATEHVTVRGGLRFTRDEGDQTDLNSASFGVDDGALVLPLITDGSQGYESNNVSGKIGLDYKPDADMLLYGSYSRGYRAKSFNAQAFFSLAEATIANPETIDAFEVGAKTQWADRRITVNGAAFYYRYANQQFIDVDPATNLQTLKNLARTRIIGAELELAVAASRAVAFNLGLGWLDSRIEDGTLRGVSVAGNQLSNAPAVSVSSGLDVIAFDTDIGKLTLHGDLSYVSSQYFEVFNTGRLRQGGYTLLGGHIDFDKGPFTVSIWGKNLLDKLYTTSRIDALAGIGYDYNHLGNPRTYGLTVGYKF